MFRDVPDDLWLKTLSKKNTIMQMCITDEIRILNLMFSNSTSFFGNSNIRKNKLYTSGKLCFEKSFGQNLTCIIHKLCHAGTEVTEKQ